ncbi:hypothetical protein TUN199_01851 [Pyrenophora tritici-repentis]|uniref:Uncharacterized protein n=1 Tax=Pyrenophora tritici-repentis TaxID=45151 RepID=A0A2W1FEE2_9PLEO|nr:hypothetical protein PtrV1_08753 [Pyrenophora tritici-repentis]KAF7570077.1 hypothetical protein PtrM4_100790 [Pyrenophora tritici-repentis]KAI0588980.1 hypothetical protein Alg215_00644 [Pyrenophora tritici-repentis]KAI0590214.1 hypothetical protein Alg130_02511 [Pyrenophora tritici-repentis]KAI0613315.1 hypothetical protein TUN205_02460 [Pyrenophora tritici-repentis]
MSQSVLMCDTDRGCFCHTSSGDIRLWTKDGIWRTLSSDFRIAIGAAASISSPPHPFETKESTSPSLGPALLQFVGFGLKKSLERLRFISLPLAPRGSVLVAPAPGFDPGLSPTHPASTDAAPVAITSQGNATSTSSMSPTHHGLRPILPLPTQVGDPYGHHEISEPDFTATRPCSGCSPVILITAAGWLDQSTRVATSSTVEPVSPQAVTTIPAGASPSASSTSIAIDSDPDSSNFAMGDSCTLTPGETIIVDDTPIGIPTSTGGTEVGMVPSATALVVNGQTSNISTVSGSIYTKVVPAALNYNNKVYTANHAGYIVMGPGTTLIPGGTPVTINGTTLSLEHSGTAVLIQSTTQSLEPVTTVVTLKRGSGALKTGCGAPRQSTGDVYVYPTATPVSAGGIRSYGTVPDGWLGSVILLMWCGIGIVLRI